MSKRKLSPIQYIGIAAIVAVGAVVARLIVLVAMASVAENQITNITERAQDSIDRISHNAVAQQEIRREETKRQRAESKVGRDLLRRCDEFTEFYRDHPGSYAMQERDKACEKYSDFVLTGRR